METEPKHPTTLPTHKPKESFLESGLGFTLALTLTAGLLGSYILWVGGSSNPSDLTPESVPAGISTTTPTPTVAAPPMVPAGTLPQPGDTP